MAVKRATHVTRHFMNPPKRRTSIGRSVNTRPTNKNKRRNFKRYRGQG